MDTQCPSIKRALHSWEIQEAASVFTNQIDYTRVRVHECNAFPNRVHRIGCWLKRIPYSGNPNAITLGNHCYFPVRLPQTALLSTHPEFYKISWLMHELTHVWQYQHIGWRYLLQSLLAQFRDSAHAYEFGGEDGLREWVEAGKNLADFNLEQQGEVVRTYYERLKKGEDTQAWEPFIEEIQQPG